MYRHILIPTDGSELAKKAMVEEFQLFKRDWNEHFLLTNGRASSMDDDDEVQGALILFKALGAPAMQVASNAGIEGAVVLSKIQSLARENGVSTTRFADIMCYLYISFFRLTVLRSIMTSMDGDGTLVPWNIVT